MNKSLEEQNKELQFQIKRMEAKYKKLLDMVANYAHTVVELEVDIEMLDSHIQQLNKQLEEAQG